MGDIGNHGWRLLGLVVGGGVCFLGAAVLFVAQTHESADLARFSEWVIASGVLITVVAAMLGRQVTRRQAIALLGWPVAMALSLLIGLPWLRLAVTGLVVAWGAALVLRFNWRDVR